MRPIRRRPGRRDRSIGMEKGYAVFVSGLSEADLTHARAEADHLAGERDAQGGVRNVMNRSAAFRDMAATGPLSVIAMAILGENARPVKATLFDKATDANWRVPWHQDLTIAVRERNEAPGFGPWTVKAGVAHVQPPTEVLERMIALRLHLDDTTADNGALHVVPGSHLLGRIDPGAISELRRGMGEVVCGVPAGWVMAMRPLLLHASSPTQGARRRVLHVEYASDDLPCGLAWIAQCDSLSPASGR